MESCVKLSSCLIGFVGVLFNIFGDDSLVEDLTFLNLLLEELSVVGFQFFC